MNAKHKTLSVLLTLALAFFLISDMGSVCFAAEPIITGYGSYTSALDRDQESLAYDVYLHPGEVIPVLPTGTSDNIFYDGNDILAADVSLQRLKDSRITIGVIVTSGSNSLGKFEFDSNGDIIFSAPPAPWASIIPQTLKGYIYLIFNGIRTDSQIRWYYEITLDNHHFDVDSSWDYCDISDYSVADATDYIRNIEVDLGCDVAVVLTMFKNRSYWGYTTCDISGNDLKLMTKYPQIKFVRNLTTIGMNAGKVKISVVGTNFFYVYGENLKYLGTTNDLLPYSTKYYLCSKKLISTSNHKVVHPIFYTVTFDLNDGDAAANQSVQSGGKVKKPADPLIDSHIFAGWYSDSALTQPYDFTKGVTGNLTIYAKWMPEQEPWANPFTDVQPDDWFYDAVAYMNGNGLMNGTSVDKFSPYANITRSMIVTILYNLAGQPAGSDSNAFSDVADDAWYAKSAAWALANGIVEGYGDGSFGPNDSLPREQLAVILYRYTLLIDQGPQGAWLIQLPFSDGADISEWATEAVTYLYLNNITNGKPGNVFDPQSTASRAEAATMLHKWLSAVMKL